MEKAKGTIWRESLVPFNGRRWCQFICEPHDSRNLLLVVVIEQEQLCVLLRMDLCEAEVGTRQPLNDAWDVTNWDGLCGAPWPGPPLPWIVGGNYSEDWAEMILRAVGRHRGSRSHWRFVLGFAPLASHGRATKPHISEWRDWIRTIIERILTGKARMHTKTESPRQSE